MARLAVLGGGGFRVPLVYRALCDQDLVDEVALYDVDADRLAVVGAVLEQLAAGHARAPEVVPCTDLDDALAGAAFVFAAIRVGGLSGRTADERVALRHGVLGQETTGPGGVCYGLRTVPVMTEIAERVDRVCPDAWVVNFTNPAGMVTEAMSAVLGDRVIGICDSPIALGRRAARALGVDPAAASPRYFGLNHLGWLAGLVAGGRDLLPDLLADDARLASFEEGRLFGATWIRALGMVPNEYLFYYYANREAVRAVLDAPETRGELLRTQQERFYAAAATDPASALDVWERTRRERQETYLAESRGAGDARDADDLESGGYEGVAVALMSALSRGTPTELVLDVRNRGALPVLPVDAVVEVPCLVDAAGARPLAVGDVPGHAAGLMCQLKSVERDAIRAALTGDRSLALRALGTHPLVDSVREAERILDEYVAVHPQLNQVFRSAS
ncbi:MAG: 6-phospho-beta-glucosidase [Streptosporangiales bacterium]|nr:6-phospho-beta-glucosidase [Streptosporangiales bacterium]MBO0891979.1 6-phospho-beta-glucosidase [Acidothermales bacterium]